MDKEYNIFTDGAQPGNSRGWPEGQKEGFIPIDGGRVFYHFYGMNRNGIPMIFLHGGPGGAGSCFFRQIPLASDHPLVIYNQLGSDGSDFAERIRTAEQAQELLTIDRFADELQTVIDYFGFTEYILVGCSWGSMLAVEYAAAKQPKGLKGIVLSGPFLNTDKWCEDAERLLKSLGEYTLSDGTDADGSLMWEIVQECEASGVFCDDPRYSDISSIYAANFFSRPENTGCDEGTPSDAAVTRYAVSGLSVYHSMWGKSEFSCTGTLRGHDSSCLLHRITVPVLFLCGQYDCATPETAALFNEMTPHGEIIVLPGCGHNASMEKPEAFNAAIRAFSDRISGSV